MNGRLADPYSVPSASASLAGRRVSRTLGTLVLFAAAQDEHGWRAASIDAIDDKTFVVIMRLTRTVHCRGGHSQVRIKTKVA